MSDLNPEGLAAARRYARWHIGDRSWADLILNAYQNPEVTNTQLDEDSK